MNTFSGKFTTFEVTKKSLITNQVELISTPKIFTCLNSELVFSGQYPDPLIFYEQLDGYHGLNAMNSVATLRYPSQRSFYNALRRPKVNAKTAIV